MTTSELFASLSDMGRKHADPAAPLPMKMMAAKGMAPLPPADMVMVLCVLATDEDPKIAQTATDTLKDLPEKLLSPTLDTALPGAALAFLGPLLAQRPAMQQKVVLNRAMPDEAIAALAETASAQVAEIIAENQERCLRSEAVVRTIVKNPNILKSSLDRLFDFLVRSGLVLDDLPQFGEALARLSPTEMQQAAERISLPPHAEALIDKEEPAEVEIQPENEQPEAKSVYKRALEIEEESKHRSIQQIITSLNVAQKIALAIRGNKEARSMLVRDSN